MTEADVIRAGPLMTAQILWIEGVSCMKCSDPATHYVLQPVDANELSNRTFDKERHLAVMAKAYCSEHSPAVQPTPRPKKGWRWFLR